jgi:diguanylate cyclase (GGDEF)-like protein
MLIMLSNQAGLAIENSQLYEKTVIRAHSDSLTELWNHGYFQYLLGLESEKAKAVCGNLSLMILDIDDFKVYNDSLGHQSGDNILKELAALLKGQSRKMDHVCRYGGEEFAIILPQTEKKEALFIAERLRENIARHHFLHEEILPSKRLTVSIGLSSYPQDGIFAAELITNSDKALYQAKSKGKNNTVTFD